LFFAAVAGLFAGLPREEAITDEILQ